MPTLVTFGDSTTALRAGVEVYTSLLQREMPASLRWMNRGVPGNTTDLARERFEPEVLRERPEIVVIQFGINDATLDVWKEPSATKHRVALPRYEENLRFFIHELRKQQAQVILMTPNPIRWAEKTRELYGRPPYEPEAEQGFTKFLSQYAAAARGIAQEESAPLIDVDALYDDWERATGRSCSELLPDGMHPGNEGHRLVADNLRPALERLLKLSLNL